MKKRKPRITHGHAGHGRRTSGGTRNPPTPTYSSWLKMRGRCLNPNNDRFQHYGGRGISICERWQESFENFLADMGERPAGMSIDRIDVDGNYEPSNCRWATIKEQNDNTRRSKLSAAERVQVAQLAASGASTRDLAERFGICTQYVCQIRRQVFNDSRGTSHKLTAEKVAEIRSLIEQGRSKSAIARQFGVSRPAIQHIVSGRTWRAA